jgi:hypothetical protein
MTDAPGTPPPPANEPPPPPHEWASPQSLKPAGITLVVYNSLSVLSGLMSVAMWPFLQRTMSEAAKKQPEMKQVAEMYQLPWLTAVNWMGLVLSIVALIGSIYLLRGRNYGLAMTGAIVTMVNPGGCCCCLVGTALGIWGLVVMLRPDSQAAFNRP